MATFPRLNQTTQESNFIKDVITKMRNKLKNETNTQKGDHFRLSQEVKTRNKPRAS